MASEYCRTEIEKSTNCILWISWYFLLSLFAVTTVEFNQINSAKSYQRIDYSGKQRHTAKQDRDQIEIKYSHQTPVDTSNDGNGKSETIEIFHKSFPPLISFLIQ